MKTTEVGSALSISIHALFGKFRLGFYPQITNASILRSQNRINCRCRKCGSIVGDGDIKSDSCGDGNCPYPNIVHSNRNPPSNDIPNENSGSFSLDDLRSIRFDRHKINMSDTYANNYPESLILSNISTEQTLCRVIKHIRNICGVSTFLLESNTFTSGDNHNDNMAKNDLHSSADAMMQSSGMYFSCELYTFNGLIQSQISIKLKRCLLV